MMMHSLPKLNRIFFPPPISKFQTLIPPSLSSNSSSHAGKSMEDTMTQGVDTDGETNQHHQDHDDIIPTREDDHYMHPKTPPPNLSSSKLQTPAVNKPFDPHVQQKRNFAKEESRCACAGLDGSPWPDDDKSTGSGSGRKEVEEDDKDYFQHHKPSPLSEIEMDDSRKPLTRVSQGTAGGYFGDEPVMMWSPEQLDTAEDSLRRAREMFREAAARGVPEWPHSRRLRELRGEDW